MTNVKINYSEGDIISIPLTDNSGRAARGVVARMDGKGRIFGYFFPPSDDGGISEGLAQDKAILVGKFGDRGLTIEGTWKVVGKVEPWSRDEWPFPKHLLRVDEIDKVAYLTEYDPETLQMGKEQKFDLNDIDPKEYYKDSLMGAGFVEERLTQLVNE